MSTGKWYYADYNGQRGPLSFEKLKAHLLSTPNAENVLVWTDGFKDWRRVGDIADLQEHVASPPPLPPVDEVSRAPTWKIRWWWLIFAIGFPGGIGSQVGRRVMIWNSAERRRIRVLKKNN
ncbi:MAG: DUF4339 domain-containing protein [Rhizobiales bacterium]|nr:DUF4339 domain-containing protein [Hyphomicrobiales bacterium]